MDPIGLTDTPVFAAGLLQGRTALFTGGGSGLGYAIAQRYAALGASTVLVGRRAEKLEGAVRAIKSFRGTALSVPADVRIYEQMTFAVEQTSATFGSLDILVKALQAICFAQPSGCHRTPTAWLWVLISMAFFSAVKWLLKPLPVRDTAGE